MYVEYTIGTAFFAPLRTSVKRNQIKEKEKADLMEADLFQSHFVIRVDGTDAFCCCVLHLSFVSSPANRHFLGSIICKQTTNIQLRIQKQR